jgi:C-terminal processing protease CtpA/Prc
MGNTETKAGSYGYRVIKVAPGSPAQQAGLIEFLDFIVDLSCPNEHTPLTGNYADFF